VENRTLKYILEYFIYGRYYKDVNFITFLKLFRTEKSVKKQSSCEILQKTFANDLIYSLSLYLRLSYNCLSKV
jgi:hypothetical protein